MAIRLKSLFRAQQFTLALKALTCALFLALVKREDFGVIPILFFAAASFSIYFTPLSNIRSFLISFLVLVPLSLAAIYRLGDNIALSTILVVGSALFYILFGLKNLFFIYRERYHEVLHLALFYILALLFFLTDQSNYFLWTWVLTSAIIFILGAEFFQAVFRLRYFSKGTAEESGSGHARENMPILAAGIVTFLVLETLLALSFLPLGFLNSANLALLSFFVFGDVARRYLLGELTRKATLINLTIFVTLTILIFATSQWEI